MLLLPTPFPKIPVPGFCHSGKLGKKFNLPEHPGRRNKAGEPVVVRPKRNPRVPHSWHGSTQPCSLNGEHLGPQPSRTGAEVGLGDELFTDVYSFPTWRPYPGAQGGGVPEPGRPGCSPAKSTLLPSPTQRKTPPHPTSPCTCCFSGWQGGAERTQCQPGGLGAWRPGATLGKRVRICPITHWLCHFGRVPSSL